MYRVDVAARRSGFRATPQGGLEAKGYVTRAGVFTYQVSDGKGGTRPFRELRHPDEVFHADSLASLAAAPVTRGHPAGGVSSKTWTTHAIGHGGDTPAREGIYVATPVRVQDAAAVADIEAGKLVEFSCGYDCDVILEQGTYDGIPYDGVQKNIRYNHIGLGPRNWGRAGNEVRIREDAADGVEGVCLHEDAEPAPYAGSMTLEEALKQLGAEKARADQAEGALKARTDGETALAKQVETLKGELAATVKRADSLESSIGTRVAARIALETSARAVLGKDAKLDGLSDHDVRVAAIVKLDPEFKADGLSGDFVVGTFTAMTKRADAVEAGLAALKAVTTNVGGGEPQKSPLEIAYAKADAADKAAPAWTISNVKR